MYYGCSIFSAGSVILQVYAQSSIYLIIKINVWIDIFIIIFLMIALPCSVIIAIMELVLLVVNVAI